MSGLAILLSGHVRFSNLWRNVLAIVIFNLVLNVKCQTKTRPNIVFILADDLGWNDVGFHGSNQIPTPNIDALAYSGLILQNYYVNPICTPSRSALMTGKYPIHTGMQHRVLYAAEPRGLPLNEKILPQYLKDLGYTNRIVGKWHLGHYTKEYTPLHRGFDSHLGFWSGHQDYYDHTADETGFWGLDMRRGMDVAWDLHGHYSTDIFTDEAVRLVRTHNVSQPLFLYVAHAAVHSGNPYNPLPAPDEVVAKLSNISNYQRRRFAAMLTVLDNSVGRIVEALANNKMLSNTIIVFSTDNGGPAEGFNINAASNWPLRGVKNTLWEGGVRGAGLVWSPMLQKPQRVAHQMMHITDWLPTLYTAAGGDSRDLKGLDAIDQWKSLSEDRPSDRAEVLHNIDDKLGSASLTIGKWKIHKGTNYNGAWDGWYGPSGRDYSFNVTLVMGSKAAEALRKISMHLDADVISQMRDEATIKCKNDVQPIVCRPLVAPCLFNIEEDPCERRNLATSTQHKAILMSMLEALSTVNRTAVPPGNLPIDPRGDPRFWDHTWTNFGDYSLISSAS